MTAPQCPNVLYTVVNHGPIKRMPRADRAKHAQAAIEQIDPSAVRFGDTLRAPDGDHKVCRIDSKAHEYVTTNGERTGRFSYHVVRTGLVEHYRNGKLIHHSATHRYIKLLGD